MDGEPSRRDLSRSLSHYGDIMTINSEKYLKRLTTKMIEHWTKVIDLYVACDLSIEVFCETYGCRPKTLQYYAYCLDRDLPSERKARTVATTTTMTTSLPLATTVEVPNLLKPLELRTMAMRDMFGIVEFKSIRQLHGRRAVGENLTDRVRAFGERFARENGRVPTRKQVTKNVDMSHVGARYAYKVVDEAIISAQTILLARRSTR